MARYINVGVTFRQTVAGVPLHSPAPSISLGPYTFWNRALTEGSPEQYKLEQQFNHVWDFDDGDTLREDDEYVDTYIIGPFEIEEVNCKDRL